MIIHLLIESRSELINQLSEIIFNENHEFLTLFNDSHEITIFMNDFKSIFMFVTDIDIATQLSYLRKLIDEYN
jgi:hemoglobin-like flavoprotein